MRHDTIKLRCPSCGYSLTSLRDPLDYPEAVRLEILCGDCSKGDFAESAYYDAAGNHITRDPAQPPSEAEKP
jgi:hypothetical protein